MSDSPAAGNPASTIPVDALTTAAEVIAIELRKVPWIDAAPERIRALAYDCAARALDLAAPLIAAAERERMVTLTEHELSAEAVAAVEKVMRERFEQTVIKSADEAMTSRLAELEAAACGEERKRIIRLARKVDARFVASLPDGGWRQFADLLREDGND